MYECNNERTDRRKRSVQEKIVLRSLKPGVVCLRKEAVSVSLPFAYSFGYLLLFCKGTTRCCPGLLAAQDECDCFKEHKQAVKFLFVSST